MVMIFADLRPTYAEFPYSPRWRHALVCAHAYFDNITLEKYFIDVRFSIKYGFTYFMIVSFIVLCPILHAHATGYNLICPS